MPDDAHDGQFISSKSYIVDGKERVVRDSLKVIEKALGEHEGSRSFVHRLADLGAKDLFARVVGHFQVLSRKERNISVLCRPEVHGDRTDLSTRHDAWQVVIRLVRRFVGLPDDRELGMQTLEASNRQLRCSGDAVTEVELSIGEQSSRIQLTIAGKPASPAW